MLACGRDEIPPVVLSAAVGAFFVAIAWRLLTFPGFSNDHYVHLAWAQQLLLGDRPIRDFMDPGEPLMYLLSAAAQIVGGATLGTELFLVLGAFALGAALTLIAAYRLSSSLVVAVGVAVAEIAINPRTYSYPKIMLYAAAAWAILAVAVAPSRRRVLLLAAVSAVAFLFRHDHGLYIGAASLTAVAVSSRRDGVLVALQRTRWWSAGVAIILGPWVVFVALNGGLVSYFASGLEFSRVEAQASNLRTWPRVRLLRESPAVSAHPVALISMLPASTSPGDLGLRSSAQGVRGVSHRLDWRLTLRSKANAEAYLFWLFWALPAAAAYSLWRRPSGVERWPGEGGAVAALALLAVLVNGGFLRDTLEARLPDAIVPAALLASWLISIGWNAVAGSMARIASRATIVVLVSMTIIAVSRVSDVEGQIDRSRLTAGIPAMRARVQQVSQLISRPHRQNLAPPSPLSASLMPFFEYLDRCSTPADRIMLTSLNPEVLVMAGRGFAAGSLAVTAGYSSTARQLQTIERLRAQRPPFALITNLAAFRATFPRVHDHLMREYAIIAEVPLDHGQIVPILVNRQIRPVGIDPETQWPCFR